MKSAPSKTSLALLVAVLAVLVLPLQAGSLTTAKPEEVGFSADRLQRIHEAVQRHIDAGDITGAVTLVARRGRVAYLDAQGVMDLDAKRPMAKDSIFRLASMSKPITAVATLMLVEEGKLRLTDPVSQFIPSFKGLKVAIAKPGASPVPGVGAVPSDLVAPEHEITIRDLLTHTAGFLTGGVGSRDVAKLAPKGETDTLAGYIPRLGVVALDFQPGTQWKYSALGGFEVLGRIAEIVSGQPYDQFLKQRIFDPLGMKDTGFIQPEARAPRVVTVYRKAANGLEPLPNQNGFTSNTYFSGAAGLMTTAEDYLQFGQMLLNGGALNGRRLLGQKTVELMASNHVASLFPGFGGLPGRGIGFGLGMAVMEDAVTAGVRVSNGSFGWSGAYGTQFWVDPKEKLVSILMVQTNNATLQRDFENALRQAIVE